MGSRVTGKAPPKGLFEAAIFAAVLAAFWPALAFPFLRWDDARNVVENEWLRFDRLGIAWMATGAKLGHWQPLTWASLALDRTLWGGKAGGFHLTSVLLHALNAVLVYALARRLKLGSKTDPTLAAVFAALFWALHPLRVESVAWVTERRDVLCGALSLAAALAYLKDDDKPERARALRLAALALSALAMTAKVFAVVLPALWLLQDWRAHGRPRWKEKLAYLPFAAVALVMNIGAQSQSGASVSWTRFGLWPRLAQSFLNLAFYPWKTVLPVRLSPLYELSLLLQAPLFAAAACSVAVVGVLIFLARRREPGLYAAALAYTILLAPALGLFKSGRMSVADRWSYMPAIPLSFVAAAALARLPGRAAALALVAALLVLTRRQLPVWASDRALWNRATEISRYSWFAVERRAEAEDREHDFSASSASRKQARELRRFVLTKAAQAYELRGERVLAEETRMRSAEGSLPAP